MYDDEFGYEHEPAFAEDAEPVKAAPAEPHIPMRVQFPEAGSTYLGGLSDGWEYRTVFGGARLATTYLMVQQFLQEEGYGDIPIPSAEEIKLFRKPRHPQLQLFNERGYIHNPIKILFSNMPGQRNNLIVCIYNEAQSDHLLRFHGVLPPKK